ncbi:Uncharacterised protein [Klebsiella pneumoniae]|nr:Uncharacterised protein [Klebsiella pneumoniae]SYB34013.1 Uncharacterised protein [Klebsiella pneumoniae]SYB48517.1 Uncharacterised protein [Klebsiella pneumoniae]
MIFIFSLYITLDRIICNGVYMCFYYKIFTYQTIYF